MNTPKSSAPYLPKVPRSLSVVHGLRNKDEWAEAGNSRVHITGYDGMMSMRIDALQLPAGERFYQAMRTLHIGDYRGWFYKLFLSITGVGMLSIGLLGFLSFCQKAFR